MVVSLATSNGRTKQNRDPEIYAEAADYRRRYLARDCQSEWATRARRLLKFCEMQSYLIASA
jgi:hypothetical protein